MGSRREEERNEKIIRGLMKLPPNRRCINCNSLGPQYVCTNFWTFVCMTCSGIHREFTHRVKSVSMAKFTSQEVEALQNGGNQRARETYLNDWDPQRQRLPDSSNVDKVRQFIKNVYVDRKYAGGKSSEKPPRDLQRLASQPDDTRRASSYHSYSQSPPYDYQYEERRYGKVASLTRKPGSDRGHYIWKSSSFVSSPGRMSEQMFEDRFANESTSSRVSDYSVSSGSDLFRYGRESPNFQKDIGYNSPPIQPSRDTSSPNANFSRDVDVIPRPQRTVSSASIGSVDSNSMSLKSYNSGGFLDVVSEPDHAAVPRLDKTSSFPQSSVPLSYGGLDLFQQQVARESVSAAAPPIDLFNLPAVTPPAGPSTTVYQPSQTSASLDLFETAGHSSVAILDGKPSELSTPKNEGWATFDTPVPAVSISGNGNVNSTMISEKESSMKFDQPPSFDTSTQWQPFPNSVAQVPASSFNSWFGGLNHVQAPSMATSTQSWKAFDDSIGNLHSVGGNQSSEPQLADDKPLSTGDQSVSPIVAEASNNDGTESTVSHYEPAAAPIASHADIGQSCNESVLPPTGETHVHASDRKSINPFDFPCDSDFEPSDMFLDMNSLQAALPDTEPPSTFISGVSQQWFPPNPLGPLIPAAAQGGVAYMSGQAPNPQLPNVPTQEPVASIGGNPFA